MKFARLLCLLIAAMDTGWLAAAPPPVPVVEITSMHLPRVKIRISNPDRTNPCHLWDPGTQWEEQNKWFSIRTSAGGKVWELHPVSPDYTIGNRPTIESIPPGGELTFEYDFSKRWILPAGFTPGEWKFEIRAHLEIPYGRDAHRRGVFCGHVKSGWYDSAGGEAEKPEKPVQEEKQVAVESVENFPFERLKARLEEWKTGTLPGQQSLADFFGAEFPWGGLKCFHAGARSLTLFLPECGELRIQFGRNLPDAFRTRPVLGERYKSKRIPAGDWRPVKEVFAKTPGTAVTGLILTKGAWHTQGEILFSRYFEAGGKIREQDSKDVFFGFWELM